MISLRGEKAKMPVRSFYDPFPVVRKEFYDGKRRFIDDIRGQIEEDVELQELLQSRRMSKGRRVPFGESRVVVTFDRKKGDNSFSYGYFDVLLVLIDALSGGNGIMKPVNQLRLIHWNGTRTQLLDTLRIFGGLNSQVAARRILILGASNLLIGSRIDRAIYLR